MFIHNDERDGTCYFEFQFCKNKRPVIFNKVRTSIINHWAEDSLVISSNNFDEFYKLYGIIFECALFPNEKKGFYGYGINYYDKNITEKILFELKDKTNGKYLNLINWLEKAVNEYNGFYILGI